MKSPTLFSSLGWLGLAGALVAMSQAAKSEPQKEPAAILTGDANHPLHRMAGGIGASWHAIRVEYQSGSNARYKYGVRRRMYEPQKGQFDWDNEEMRTLYRILDWCQRNNADVFLTEMWRDVDWLAYPDVHPLVSAPQSLEDFADGLATLADHLIRRKHFYGYAMLTRFAAKHSQVLPCEWKFESRDTNPPRVFAGALRSPRGRLTLILANREPAALEVSFRWEGLDRSRVLHHYEMTEDKAQKPGFKLAAEGQLTIAPRHRRCRNLRRKAHSTSP